MNRTLAGRPPATLVMLCACLAWVFVIPPTAYALDLDKRLTQYLHRSFRMPDGSAPESMFTITQTTDGFLWLSSLRELYRFDGIRFVRWDLPAQGSLAATVMNAVADRAGGLWMITDSDIAHVKDGAVLSDSALTGVLWQGDTTVEADGSLWVVRSRNAVTDAPLCRLTDRAVKCFGAAEGIPIAPADALMADGNGGFWIGGQTALVHWRDGVSQVYPIEALKSNAGNNGISSLARTPVVRQYSHGCANHVANISRTERSVGLATTLTTRLFFELRLRTAIGQARAGKLISHCRRARRPCRRARKKVGTDVARRAATVGAAAGHGRCSCALLCRPEGDFCRDARRRTRAGADAPNRRSAGEWRRATHRSTELGEPTGHRGRRRCPLRAHPRTSPAR
jgi:hypothetical protein